VLDVGGFVVQAIVSVLHMVVAGIVLMTQVAVVVIFITSSQIQSVGFCKTRIKAGDLVSNLDY
jgi:hypothetical protein